MRKLFFVLLAFALVFASCSNSAEGSGGGTQTGDEITIPPEDAAKSDTQLVKEANAALSEGDYTKAVNKFRYAYKKRPTDSNKIFYALTEIALLSVDDTVVDIMKNKVGATSYPATLNALFNTEWAKDKSQTLLGSEWSKTFPSYESYPIYTATQNNDGSYIRASGTRTSTYDYNTTRSISYILDDGEWWIGWNHSSYKKITSGSYLTNVTPDANGPYLVWRDSTKDTSVAAEYRYNATHSYDKAVPGKTNTLPILAVPSWVTSIDSYKSTLIGTTLSAETWTYLLFANAVTNNENGLNDVIDKLLPVVHKKSETVKGVVDSLGNETATLEASFIKALNLTEWLGEDAFEIGKPEMNLLVAALEGFDAVLNYAASYDLSANLKAAQGDIGSKQTVLKMVKASVSSKTLTNRDSEKLASSKALFLDGLNRLISSYNSIKSSTRYPQIIKDNLDQYGEILYDGGVKAKAAIENGSVLYIPEKLEGKAFPADLNSALFGIDMGKVFTPGYLTKFFERSDDLSTVKLYYKQVVTTTNTSTYARTETEGPLTEITDIDTFFNNTISDAGHQSGSGSYTDTSYSVGVLANYSVLSAALPSANNIAEKIKFMEFWQLH